jgi:hypothetical protein
MNAVVASLIVIALLAAAGCSGKRDDASTASAVSRQETEKPSLLSAMASKNPDAVRQVSAKLKEEGEDPSKFHTRIEEKDGGSILVFRLFHEDTFLSKNRNVVGNPSGKDREILFDSRTGKASRSSFYQ